MKIRHKGRTYDDTPTPQVLDGEGQRDNYSINRVAVREAYQPSQLFLNSRRLMDYLDAWRSPVEMTIDGEAVPLKYVFALSAYLFACRGLQSFRRDRVTWHSRADLVSLLSQVGFPSHYVTRLQPSNSVQAGLKNTPRTASHCGAS